MGFCVLSGNPCGQAGLWKAGLKSEKKRASFVLGKMSMTISDLSMPCPLSGKSAKMPLATENTGATFVSVRQAACAGVCRQPREDADGSRTRAKMQEKQLKTEKSLACLSGGGFFV
jgi:hypothetical protein